MSEAQLQNELPLGKYVDDKGLYAPDKAYNLIVLETGGKYTGTALGKGTYTLKGDVLTTQCDNQYAVNYEAKSITIPRGITCQFQDELPLGKYVDDAHEESNLIVLEKGGKYTGTALGEGTYTLTGDVLTTQCDNQYAVNYEAKSISTGITTNSGLTYQFQGTVPTSVLTVVETANALYKKIKWAMGKDVMNSKEDVIAAKDGLLAVFVKAADEAKGDFPEKYIAGGGAPPLTDDFEAFYTTLNAKLLAQKEAGALKTEEEVAMHAKAVILSFVKAQSEAENDSDFERLFVQYSVADDGSARASIR